MVKKTDSEATDKYDVFISYSSKDKEWVRGEHNFLLTIDLGQFIMYVTFMVWERNQ